MRILFLTHRLPYAPNRGDRIRAYHLLRLLASRHEVHVVSLLHDEEERRRLPDLNGVAATVEGAPVTKLRNRIAAAAALSGSRPLTHVLLSSAAFPAAVKESVARARPDVVLAYCTGIAEAVFHHPLAAIPYVLDMVDVDSEKWAELAQTSRVPMKWIYGREARMLRAFERVAVARASATTVVSAREQELAQRTLGGSVIAVPNGVDIDYWSPPPGHQQRPDVVFCGVFNYEPNERGAIWFASEVWPLVKRREPAARLRLVGMSPSTAVRALAAADSIEVTGPVPDVRPYIWPAAVAVAPLWVARGTQNKVLEALAGGVRCVVTPAVRDGLPQEARDGCIACLDAPGFADAILSMLRQPMSEPERATVRRSVASLSWASQLAPFLDLVEDARGSSMSSANR